jgi:hypothetical protein
VLLLLHLLPSLPQIEIHLCLFFPMWRGAAIESAVARVWIRVEPGGDQKKREEDGDGS